MRKMGLDGDTLRDRIEEISPDSPSYKFWVWLRLKLNQRWWDNEDYVTELALAKYRAIYRHVA